MKTFIIAAIIVVFSGILSSCHKMSLKNLRTATTVVANFSNATSRLATAD